MSITQLPEKLRITLWCTAVGAAIGAVYAEFVYGLANFAWHGVPRGALTGALIASILTSLEVYLLWTPLGWSLRRAPFAVHVAVKTLIYLIVIVSALSFGAWAFPAPGEGGIEGNDVLFSLAASFVFVFVMEVNKLLGQNVLLSFVTGRYYRPRLEERVLLFIDMEGSTGLAERLGPLAFHRLLNRFVTDLTDPIVAARGEIYSYVGDELIATWKLEEGISQARCVRACSTPLTCSLERRTNTGANLALLSIFVPGCIAVPSSPARWGRLRRRSSSSATPSILRLASRTSAGRPAIASWLRRI